MKLFFHQVCLILFLIKELWLQHFVCEIIDNWMTIIQIDRNSKKTVASTYVDNASSDLNSLLERVDRLTVSSDL